jgi:hypothetical protein
MKRIKRFDDINEGFFDQIFNDPGNKDAIQSYLHNDKFEYTFKINEPVKIVVTDYDEYRFLFKLLNRLGIKFDFEQKEL